MGPTHEGFFKTFREPTGRLPYSLPLLWGQGALREGLQNTQSLCASFAAASVISKRRAGKRNNNKRVGLAGRRHSFMGMVTRLWPH